MINRRTFAVAALAAGLLGAPLARAAGDPAGDPEKWMLDVSEDIIAAIKADAKIAQADPEHVRRFVTEKIMPTVDFLRITRSSVGPKWRQATPDQKEELQTLFRELLTRVYSGALAAVKDQTVKLAPNRVKPTETDALVRTLMVAPGKPDIHIDYRLKKLDGRWRIIDVDVEGVWLVENYRSQFAGIVNGSGIEGLVKALREKTQAAGK